MRAPNVWTIPPACPFLDTFVRALAAGTVVPGVCAAGDPLWLADLRIYVPTQRSGRALADAFRAHAAATSGHAALGHGASGHGAVVLPRILPLGALEGSESIYGDPFGSELSEPLPDFFPANISTTDLLPAAGEIWRRLQLATLIKAWADAIGGALRTVDKAGRVSIDDAEAFRVASSTADAYALAEDLARLIDELAIEGVAWRALDDLRMAEFDDYWRITTTFLAVAVTKWPAVLASHGLLDKVERQIALVDAQARALLVGQGGAGSGAVVAIGSTGSNRATARLLAAIATAPRGAVVLPGLDRELDDAAWKIVSGQLADGQEPGFSHPQAALARLLPQLGVDRAAICELGTPDPVLALRERFVAQALRPADTTDLWRAWRKGVAPAALAAALAGVTLVEAADEREEALCLAIAMRNVLETPGRTAALVTPDRELARRVRGELLRWGVEVTDTGGEPLANRPLGVLARLVAGTSSEAVEGRATVRDIGGLLAHPLVTLGRPRFAVARLAAMLEVGVLRAVVPRERDAAAIFAEARRVAGDRHAHPAQRAIDADDWLALAELWDALDGALAPILALRGEQRLPAWVAAHRAALAILVGEAAADEQAALDDIFAELEAGGLDTRGGLPFDAEGYAILFARVSRETALRNTVRPHPRLQIFGLIEARLMRADVMLLGGLDETVWPPQAQSDPFLNRPMRGELGLSPPERRIGQTAHDFAQAMGNPAVVVSRAAKRGNAPTVPSRFLLRCDALGAKAWNACRERGAALLGLARLVDSSIEVVSAKRPQPRPAVALRPSRLSVTEIETLRRDPYAIYAAHILELVPLPAVGGELGAGEFGTLMHAVLHRFVEHEGAGVPARRGAVLDEIARAHFAVALDDPVFAAFRWPALLQSLAVFLDFDTKQRALADLFEVERGGKLTLTLADRSAFILTARADRIDRHRDGTVTLIDYKTGQPPGLREVQVGFAPQLTLEAAMLREGGFGAPHAAEVAGTYLKLGGKTGGFVRALVDFDDETFGEVVDRHWAQLQRMLSAFRSESTAYPSRPFPKYARRYSDYDHLARVREWSLAGDEEDGA